jgi:hypothetical protein
MPKPDTPRSGYPARMSVDVEALTRLWQQLWPQCPPIGYLLRYHMPDRWLRIHTLPNSQRYPVNASDYEIVLHRYNAVLSELGATEIHLITPEYQADDLSAGTEPIHVGLHPGAVKWMHAVNPDDPEIAYDLHISRQQFQPGILDDLLRRVADWQATGVLVTDTALRWLFHPYDGGADLIASSAIERDQLKTRFKEWLSPRPDGL